MSTRRLDIHVYWSGPTKKWIWELYSHTTKMTLLFSALPSNFGLGIKMLQDAFGSDFYFPVTFLN